MANVRLDLSQFRASGVYTLEYDQSESIVLSSQTVRLVIGFSRKGPFNAPVYLPDKKTAKLVYGDIDDFLERRGAFFHRSLYSCLDYGPVFGLNLMKLNNDPDFGDMVPYQSFSLASTEKNGRKVYKLYASFYNKERFWKPDREYLLGNVNSAGSINTGKLFNVVNLGQTPVSIMIKKSTDLNGFDITAREWFGAGKVPTYIDDWDYIVDYFVDFYIVEGDWTNSLQLSIDTVFSQYFDERGLIKTKMADFLGAPEINVIGKFTGSIIPELTDGNGINHSIETIVNNNIAATGIFIAIDKNALEQYDLKANYSDTDTVSAVDMIGHNFADPTRVNPDIINFLSYRTTIKEDLDFTLSNTFLEWEYPYNDVTYKIKSDSRHYGKTLGYLDNVLVIPKPINVADDDVQLVDYLKMKNLLVPGGSLLKLTKTWDATHEYGSAGDPHWGTVEQIWEEESPIDAKTYLRVAYSHPVKASETLLQGLTINNLVGSAALTMETSDPAYFTKMTTTWGFEPNTMHVVINRPTTAGAARNKFDACIDSILEGTFLDTPAVGHDILIENKTSKVWYYFKVASPGIVAYNDTSVNSGYGYDPSGYNPVGNETGEYNQIIIPVESRVDVSDAFRVITKNIASYQTYMTSVDSVSAYSGTGSTYYPTFVYHPDKLKFVTPSVPSETTPNLFIAYKGHKLFDYYESGALVPLKDRIYFASADYTKDQNELDYCYVNYTKDKDDEGITVLKVQFYDTLIDDKPGYMLSSTAGKTIWGYSVTPGSLRLRGELGSAWSIRNGGTGTDNPSIFSDFTVYVNADYLYDSIQVIPNSWNSQKTKFSVLPAYSSFIESGNYIVSETKDSSNNSLYKLTKVVTKRKIYNSETSSYVFEYTVNQPILFDYNAGSYFVTRYKPLDSFISNYQLFHLNGFKMNDYHFPGGVNKKQQLEKILGMLDPGNSNLMNTLKERDVITFRYIVDTFDGGLDPYTGSKAWITRLAKERQKCLAIMNAPSMKEFADSNNPMFTEPPTRENPKPVLNTAYIPQGGNLSLGPTSTFSLPDEFWGSKFAGYFTPYLTLNENGKTIQVPPAAWVSNLFIQKFTNGNPWGIVAGTRRGVISERKLVGLEYEFLHADRENLEPFGLNPIIKKKGVGYMIFGNSMAYQKTKSAFNNLHVRDLLITIEEAVETVLSNYLFEFNSAATRLEIKTIVDVYLDNIRSQGGIYDFITIMDETNNTPEIIDSNTGIIDIAIEPARGLQKVINRITVMKTGGISSGGFSVQ